MDLNNLSRERIWQVRQNKPSLIADDLEVEGVPRFVTHGILLARGVYKWLSVRRKLIRLKNTWKDRIKDTIIAIKATKKIENSAYHLGYLRGYLRALEECRGEVRELCHSDRWQAPDFDREANQFLAGLGSRKP